MYVEQFLSLLVANTNLRRHSEIKQTRSSTKQDFSGEALSIQNTEAQIASLSCNSSRAPTEWSAIFAFGEYYTPTLPRTVTTLQWPLSSVPKVAVNIIMALTFCLTIWDLWFLHSVLEAPSGNGAIKCPFSSSSNSFLAVIKNPMNFSVSLPVINPLSLTVNELQYVVLRWCYKSLK